MSTSVQETKHLPLKIIVLFLCIILQKRSLYKKSLIKKRYSLSIVVCLNFLNAAFLFNIFNATHWFLRWLETGRLSRFWYAALYLIFASTLGIIAADIRLKIEDDYGRKMIIVLPFRFKKRRNVSGNRRNFKIIIGLISPERKDVSDTVK